MSIKPLKPNMPKTLGPAPGEVGLSVECWNLVYPGYPKVGKRQTRLLKLLWRKIDRRMENSSQIEKEVVKWKFNHSNMYQMFMLYFIFIAIEVKLNYFQATGITAL